MGSRGRRIRSHERNRFEEDVMAEVSRRAFLQTGAGAAAAGAVIAATGIRPQSASASSTDESEESAAAAAAAAGSLDGPVVVHIQNARSGEMSIFSGEREVTYHDPQLVARLARATGSSRV
jgi:nitrous oxide reductase